MGAKNFLDLCTSASEKKDTTGNTTQTINTGLPFLPSKAIPVDVAPHTINNTIIILFERVDPSTFPAPKKPPPVPLKRQQKKEERKKRRFHNPRKFSRGGSTFRGRPARKWKSSTSTRGGGGGFGTRTGGQAGQFFRRGGSQGFGSTRFPPPLLRQMDPALSLVAKYERRIAELEQQDRAFKAGLTMGLQALGSRGGPGGGGGGGNANFDNFESLSSNVGSNYDNFTGSFQRDRQVWQRGGRNFGNMGFGFGGGGSGSGGGNNFSGGFGSGFNFNNLGGGFGNFDRGRNSNSGGGGNFSSNFNPNFSSNYGSNFNSNFGSNYSSSYGSSNYSSNFGGGGGGGFRNYQGNKYRR